MNSKKILFLAAFICGLTCTMNGQTSPEYKILFEKAKFTMETKGDLNGAIALFNEIIKKYPKEREYAAKSQLYIGLCYEKSGVKEAQKAYRKVVDTYPEQTETVKLASAKLSILLKGESPAKSPEITIRRIWSGPDANGEGGPSPDGRYLSFTDWEIPALAVHDLTTGENRQLTKKEPGDTDGYPDYSIFSPNGKQIAYRWWIGRDVCEIRTIKPDGSDERVLYRTKENYPSKFNWSPDGMYLLTKLGERPVLIAVEDGSIQDLAIENPGMMCISPDGNYVVYDTPQDKNSNQNNIFVYDRTTHLTSVLVGHPADDKLLGWSPDGRHVLFSSDRRGSIDAWLISVSGGQPKGAPEMVRSDIGGLGYGMGFTQLGAYFFSNWGVSRDVFVTQLDIQTGKLLSPPKEVAETYLGSNWGPDFSADGKSLAYVNGQGGIIIQSLETSEKKQIKPNVEIRRTDHMAGLRWTADYRSLFGTGVIGQGREGLFSINLSTGETKLFFEPAHQWIQAFDISPDGKKVIYQGIITEGGSLCKWDSESGQESQILAGAQVWSLAVSPDGKQVAYFGSANLDKSGGLYVVSSSGGTPRLVIEAEDNRGAIAWSPDGRKLIYAIPSKSSTGSTPAKIRYQFWSVASEGGEPKQLDLTVDGMIMSLQMHPDGKRIVYQTHQSRIEIWVMENFLPKVKIEENNQLTLRKLDNSQLNEPFAGISSDGLYISYTDWNTGDLAIHDMVTSNDRLLTNKGSWASSGDNAGYSVFSPDGKQIAYTWKIWSKNQTELRIIGTDGSRSGVIYKGDDSWPVSWSLNGKYILVKLMNKDQTWRPAIIAVADSSVRDLEFQISGAMCISPDGKYIAYDKQQANNLQLHDVYLYEFATKRTSPLVKHPADDGLLGWAPDGKHLLFTSDRSGTRDAWLVTVSGGKIQGEPALVRKNIGEIEGIGFTRSGDFYFNEVLGGHNIYTAKLDFDSGKLLSQPVEAAGSYLGYNWRPDFSRDGKFMAYISNRGSGEDQGNTIVVHSIETGKEQLLKPALKIGFALRWMPDGNSFLVNGSDKNNKEGLFALDAQTGEARLIVERHFVGAPGLEISPDGNMIFYTAVAGSGIPDGEAAYNVKHYAFDLKAGQEIELAKPGNTPLVPIALSPDGKQLAFIGAGDKAGTAGICIMQASGGPSKQLVNIGAAGWASRVIAWTPDGRYLVYAVMLTKPDNTNLGQTSWELQRVSAEGGEPQRLDLKIDGLLRHLRIHPDGQQIVYYTWRGDTEAWVMKNFLPK